MKYSAVIVFIECKQLFKLSIVIILLASQVVLVVNKKTNPPASAGDVRDTILIPGLRRSPGGGHGNPF